MISEPIFRISHAVPDPTRGVCAPRWCM